MTVDLSVQPQVGGGCLKWLIKGTCISLQHSIAGLRDSGSVCESEYQPQRQRVTKVT